MRRYFEEIHDRFTRMNIVSIMGVSLMLVAFLGWLDYVTGFELSFSFFYLLPIAFSAWYAGRRFAYLIVVMCVLTWGISNHFAGQVFSSEAIRYFNGFVRLLMFLLIAWLIGELKLVNLRESTLARTDHLTGIMNTREFYERAQLEIKRSSRNGQPFSVAYIDLDNFKQVNDEQGHSAGDKLLKAITKTISSNLRETDLFARIGGDEFILLLPNTGLEKAGVVIGKLEEAVKAVLKITPVTFSAGVTTFGVQPETVDEMLNIADALMYQAKLQGKNRVFYQQKDVMEPPVASGGNHVFHD